MHIMTPGAAANAVNGTDVIIAPNAEVRAWTGSDIVRIAYLELLHPNGTKTVEPIRRLLFLVAQPVPRDEMRSFLEQCEQIVVTTGDQSMAEAVLLGKVPMTK